MTRITIEFFTAIKKVTNKDYHEVLLDSRSPNVGELIRKILEEFGPALRNAIFREDSTAFRQGIAVAVNGRHSAFLNGMDTSLKDGDKVSIGLIGK